MGFLDFIFKRGKEEPKRTQPQPSPFRPQPAPAAKPKAPAEPTIEPFVFKSNCHQRYNHGAEEMGLQLCTRTVSIEKNVNGCRGYKLKPGDGYIVKVFNDDLNKPNMSDKPMRIVSKTADKIELRGFPIEAQTPFGWQEVDYRDYGFTVYYSNGKVSKCVLHMYDRNVDLEYRKEQVQVPNSQKSTVSAQATQSVADEWVKQSLGFLAAGIDGDAVYHPLYKTWKWLVNDPSNIKKVSNNTQMGMGLLIFLSFGTVSDIDDRQQIVSLSYYFLSKALQNTPGDINIRKNRILAMLEHSEAFGYTVSSATRSSGDVFGFMGALSQLQNRDDMFKMEYADLAKSQALLSIPMFASKKRDLDAKISSNFFGQGCTPQSIISEGEDLHNQVFKYLHNKLIVEEDVDF